MRARPEPRPSASNAGWVLERFATPDLRRYRALFHRVGDEYLWTMRLLLTDEELTELLREPHYEVYAFKMPTGDEGLLELDFRVAGECEIGLFGVAAPSIGSGAGRWLMNRAIEIAWSHPIERLWLHTCTLDHPSALDFYKRSGFEPYARKVEIFPDPRSLGLTPRGAAARVPIL
ncbi:MAG TPA: GNAT family N-acetyltransferase [Candidatus Nitrosotalea sp.]|nr:GNAT family N-acetyltransferase [Candidatus Nitrosotalea sp.]